MDPLRCLNAVQLQNPLSKPLDLTKQISEALDLVKKKPRRSSCASGTHGLCSPRSDFGYESTCVPVKSSLNGYAPEPVKKLMTATENFQSIGVPGKSAAWHMTGGEREQNGAGLQKDSSEQSPDLFSAVETLSSECSTHGRAQSSSSDESSMIEIPTTNSTSLSLRVTENLKLTRERMENSPSIRMESEVLQYSDLVESRNVLSTSESDKVEFKSTQNESGLSSRSLSLTSQKRVPEATKNRNHQRKRSSAGKIATTNTVKRKKKKKKVSSSPSGFPSHGPEIKLKYTSCKEEKREGRGSDFAPYVRMEFSACTVVNFKDGRDVQEEKRRQMVTAPGIVPNTSCLQLGRLRSSVQRQTGEKCCLCGRTANAVGLGDLHGPYHSHEVDRKTSAELLINGHEDSGAKRTCESDEVRERWVHEDCSIWSAGVFLVKGRLYGLEEAVRLTQETVCSCCLTPGATLGCFFKGCPNKYHFPCALQTGCVLNEENFTLRCSKHKNKSGAAQSKLRNR